MSERGSDILAFTVTHGSRNKLKEFVPTIRATAGCWFDWAVFLGDPTPDLKETSEALLQDPQKRGIQYLYTWAENRGQHHAFAEALTIARARGYKWLLRLDDDITPRRRKWLKLMVDRLEDLRERKSDPYYRLIAAPRIVGLQNPLQHEGILDVGQSYPVEIMTLLGGACRLHPVELLEDFVPDPLLPLGRGDPQAMAEYVEQSTGGFMIRFPDIKMRHPTIELEKEETPKEALRRRMGHYWCYLGPGV